MLSKRSWRGEDKTFFEKGEDLTVRLAFNLLLFCPGKHFSLYRALRAAGSAQKIRLLCGLLFCLGQMEENAAESAKKFSIFLETEGLQSKQMALAQTIWDYASLLLYEMSPSGKSKFLLVKLDLQLTTGNSPVVTHINARCQALSLPLINYGKTKMGRKPLRALQSLNERADYPNYWGQETKRHLDTRRPQTKNRLRTNCRQHRWSSLQSSGRRWMAEGP